LGRLVFSSSLTDFASRFFSFFLLMHLSNILHVALRVYIVHHTPRVARIHGKTLQQQLVGDQTMDHELFAIVSRRYAQADQLASNGVPHLSWKHELEPEFAVRTPLPASICNLHPR
jgi:hypothetical protein